MSSRVTIGTYDGYGSREVVFDTTTPLDIRVQLDGIDAVITASSCILASGTNTVAMTTTISGGIVTAPVTSANLTTLGLQIGSQCQVSWQVTITDVDTPIVARFSEDLWVSPKVICRSMAISDINLYYTELSLSNSLPPGQTTWDPQARMAWRELRSWSSMQGTDKQIWMLKNPESLKQLERAWTMLVISRYQDARIPGNKIWADRADYHSKEVEALKSTIQAWIEKTVIATWGQEAQADRTTLKAAKSLAGRRSLWNRGKL